MSSVSNRESIVTHGLDARRMGAARGIAGSDRPEQDGCFLARGAHERDHFVRMNNSGGPVDVWRVRGVDPAQLLTSPAGYTYVPGTIGAGRLTLVDADVVTRRPATPAATPAFDTCLTVVLDSDGPRKGG